MKKKLSAVLIVLMLLVSPIFINNIFADQPPDPGGGPGGGDDPVGGGSPVGSGLAILISMGAAYGARKIYHLRKP
ncbi:MAG: hypothetical protein JW731_05715 [Bacteroidales bacterium]|nr:hypothetical protein [Bacteroidales bacterium]